MTHCARLPLAAALAILSDPKMSAKAIPDVIRAFFKSSQIPLSLSDPNQPDDPVVLVNDSFCRMTGYSPEEVLHRNCRFLQGKDTRAQSRRTIAGDLLANRDSKILIRNYRKNGEAFDNFLFIFTIMDAKGAPFLRIGSQFEVPDFGRKPRFEKHTAVLRDGIETINKEVDIARQQLIETGSLVGLTVKALLHARLDRLRFV